MCSSPSFAMVADRPLTSHQRPRRTAISFSGNDDDGGNRIDACSANSSAAEDGAANSLSSGGEADEVFLFRDLIV